MRENTHTHPNDPETPIDNPSVGIAVSEYHEKKLAADMSPAQLVEALMACEGELMEAVRIGDIELIGDLVLSVFDAECKHHGDDLAFGRCMNNSYSSPKVAASLALIRHLDKIKSVF